MRQLLLNLYSSPLDLIKATKDTQRYVMDTLRIANLDKCGSVEEIVRLFDDVSDRMCTITDSAECIRRLHRDSRWRNAAEDSFISISALMNELNCDKNLIKKFNSMPAYVGNDYELAAVIKSFKLDFDLFGSCSEKEIVQIKQLQEQVQTAETAYEQIQDTESLEKMVRLRFELARALGFKNPAEIALRDKQLNTSESVLSFLKTAENELSKDTRFALCTRRFAYTNIGSVVRSLIQLSKDLFGIKAKIDSFHDLGGSLSFQFNIYDQQDVHFGSVLFDLGKRRMKDDHPTHYTIKCRKGTDQPAVILISIGIEDLERISWHQISSLFHEYGHALHSVLSENKYQTLSGSRGPVDLAEIPSTLMEIIHENQLDGLGKGEFKKVPGDKIRKEETFQVQVATFDQLIHSLEPGAMNWTRDIANSLNSSLSDNWFCTIPHLSTYGGTYFAYIYSKVMAETIWKRITKEKSLTFEDFKKEFLCRGGTAHIDFIK